MSNSVVPMQRRFHGSVILRSIFARILTIEQVTQIRQQKIAVFRWPVYRPSISSLQKSCSDGMKMKTAGDLSPPRVREQGVCFPFFSRAWGLFSSSRIVGKKKDASGQAGISNILIATTYSFCHYRTINAHICGKVLPFSREKVLQNDVINKLTCEDAIALAKYGSQARFWSWAPPR